jgi:multiple sugar transport system substrate-binding protein
MRIKIGSGSFCLTFIVFLALFFGVISCSSEKKGEGEKTILHFVTWKPNQPKVWDEVISIFESEYPDIKVKREIGPHSTTTYHDLLTQKLKNRDTSVDVFFMDVIWPPEFASAQWAEPLDNLFMPEEQEKFLPGPILANRYNNRIYGVPAYTDSGMLFYRKDLLEKHGFEPPETWQEMVEQATVIVEREKRANSTMWGFSGQFKQYEGLICDMMEYIMSNGGMLTDPETGEALVGEEKAIESVRFVRDTIIGELAPRGVLNFEEPESLDLFIQGKAVFMRNWPYAWKISNNPKRSKIAGKVGIAKLPHFPEGESYATLGGWQLGISRYSKNKAEAWEFIEFLTSKRIQKIFALKASLAPTRQALYEDDEILRGNPQFSDMKEVFLTAYPRPRSPFYPAISNILQSFFSKALSSPESSIEDLAKEAEKEIETLRNKFTLISN